MNKFDYDILKCISDTGICNQRILAKLSGLSLGKINKSLHMLRKEFFLDQDLKITAKTKKLISRSTTKAAIILAAGCGLRMTPLCNESPKGLFCINNEKLIERVIKQLHEVNITQIYIVVGFKKEFFEYLIDKYNVTLVVNPDYKTKNNLHSLKTVADKLGNCYIIPSDLWFRDNPFSQTEFYPWYAVTNEFTQKSAIRINRNGELVHIGANTIGNKEVGLAYLDNKAGEFVKKQLNELTATNRFNDAFWETALIQDKKYITYAKILTDTNYLEFNTFNDLLKTDNTSENFNYAYIDIICKSLNAAQSDISDVDLLKAGMTNRSFIFKCKEKKYIFRIPGEGTENLISRKNEYNTYQAIKDKELCEKTVYFNAETGYKISEFLENSRNCNPRDWDDVKNCMEFLKRFHNMHLSVEHKFDLFEQIEYYEKLRNRKSVYCDYEETKTKVLSLQHFIDSQKCEYSLSHIDSVPDNFVFSKNNIYLIDWEYASMQDPHVDIAMFAIYSLYTKEELDRLIDFYFDGLCSKQVRLKIYCYTAICGLLWSNWCEYKSILGIDFGEYSLRQYRYAKDFHKIFTEENKSEQG